MFSALIVIVSLLVGVQTQCTSNYCPKDEMSGGDLMAQLVDMRRMLQDHLQRSQQEDDSLKQQLLRLQDENADLNQKIAKLEKALLVKHNCRDLLEAGYTMSGEYTVVIAGVSRRVYCDQHTDGGAWLVIQRRQDGSVDFYRNWANYTNGFGDISHEFWLGNSVIHQLTSSSSMELRIDMTLDNGTRAYAKYGHFSIGPEVDNFRLSVSAYSGNAGDKLSYHNGMKWSTKVNDPNSNNCAQYHHSAWWFRSCYESNLNGPYRRREEAPGTLRALHWYQGGGSAFSFLAYTEMKIRPA